MGILTNSAVSSLSLRKDRNSSVTGSFSAKKEHPQKNNILPARQPLITLFIIFSPSLFVMAP
jgi:hypothetical protein